MSLWGGFACPCVSSGAIVRPAGLSWKWAWGRGTSGARPGQGVPVVLSGVSIASGNAHFLHSWVPSDQHPVSGAEGCGPSKGTGTQWRREPRILPSLLAQSQSPLTWRSRKGLTFGVKAFTALPCCIKLRPARVFPSSLVPAGSPRDLSFLVISPVGTS